jgi:hypothetical protein
MVFEYKFVIIEYSWGKAKQDYKDVIAEHARHGWRFVQMLMNPSHQPKELIFERRIA